MKHGRSEKCLLININFKIQTSRLVTDLRLQRNARNLINLKNELISRRK